MNPSFPPRCVLLLGCLLFFLSVTGCANSGTEQSRSAGSDAIYTVYQEFPRENSSEFLGRGLERQHGVIVEKAGFGLYSYVLFGSKPDERSRPRYLAAIKACRDLQVADGAKSFPDSQLNILYLLLMRSSASGADDGAVMEFYDYDRAAKILSYVKAGLTNGPYLVSSRGRAIADGRLSGPILVQDLSTVPPYLVREWVEKFRKRAASGRFDDDSTIEAVALNMRTWLGIAAEQLPEVKKQLGLLIAFLKDPTK